MAHDSGGAGLSTGGFGAGGSARPPNRQTATLRERSVLFGSQRGLERGRYSAEL